VGNFAIVFCGPAALWAPALMIRDDYAKVGMMLPVVAGDEHSLADLAIYSVASASNVAASLSFAGKRGGVCRRGTTASGRLIQKA